MTIGIIAQWSKGGQQVDLNEAKIAFIICTNDNQELQECLVYLNNLDVPEGYKVEIITVMDASSMEMF